MNLYIYIILIILCLVVSMVELFKKESVIILDIVLVVLFFFLIINRSIENTPDTSTYVEEYKNLNLEENYLFGNDTTLYQFEYGYTFFSELVKFIVGDNYRIFFGSIVFINLLIVFIIFRKFIVLIEKDNVLIDEKNSFLFGPFFSIYISYFGFMYSGIVLRQSLAMSLLFVSVYCLLNKKKLIGLVILGSLFLFHNMAIFAIGILILILIDFNFKKSTYYQLTIFFLLLYIGKFYTFFSTAVINLLFGRFSEGAATISPEKINTYLGGSSDVSSYSLANFVNFIFLFLAIKLTDLNNIIQQKLLQVVLFSVCINSLCSGILAFSRVTDYYFFFSIVLFYYAVVNRVSILKLFFFSLVVVSNSILLYRAIAITN